MITHRTAESSVKTFAEHHAMLESMVRLKLHWLHRWAGLHPEEPVDRILLDRVDLWRKTACNQGGLVEPIEAGLPAWQAMASRIGALLSEYSQPDQRDRFENEAFVALRDSIAARAPIDFANEQRRDHLRAYTCGSLRVDRIQGEVPPTVFLHIANAIAPRSPFADPAYLRDCLLQVVDLAAGEHGAVILRTDTWLNSHPSWLRYFPEAWREHLGPEQRDVRWHYGFWGQFLTARGGFSAALGGSLRQTGDFPYWPRTAWCRISDLRRHLQDLHHAPAP